MKLASTAVRLCCLIATVIQIAFVGLAHAQNVTQALKVELQPLVYSDEQGTKGCGFRMLAYHESGPGVMNIADFSVNLYSAGGGMMKATAIHIPSQAAMKTPEKWVRTAPADFTVAPEDGSIAAAPIKTDKSPETVARLVVISFNDAADLYGAILSGQRMHLRIKLPRSDHYRVIAFGPKFESEADESTAQGCLKGLINRVRRSS
jgi:hypothetical protein